MVEYIPDKSLSFWNNHFEQVTEEELYNQEPELDVSVITDILDLSKQPENNLSVMVNEFIDTSLLLGRKKFCILFGGDQLKNKYLVLELLTRNSFVHAFYDCAHVGGWSATTVELC